MKCQLILCTILVFANSINGQSCRTPLGVRSECVSLYDCPSLLTAFEQRPLPSNAVNFLRQSQCGFEGYTPKVCCGPIPEGTTSRPRPSRPNTNRPYNDVDEPTVSEDSSPSPQGECGVDTNGDRVYGGQITDLDEFPWMALLGYRTRSGSVTYQCGGVLINHRYVLSAGHCVKGAIETEVGKLTTVRLGEYDTQTDEDCVDDACADPIQEVPVDRAMAHDGFSDKNKNRKDDIGLIRLAQRVRYTYYVKPICLIDTNVRLEIGNDVFVAGWGKTLKGSNSNIKLKLNMPIFDKSECESKYLTLGARLTERQICAGGVFAKDACRGDSGGPLMRKKPNGDWESVAVVSFGYGCGRDGWPGVYTSVASYKDWIISTMRATNV